MKKIYWGSTCIIASAISIGAPFFQNQANLSDSLVGQDISVILAAMPKSDRSNLEYFFRESIGWHQFGYVLLGEKPMALGTFKNKITLLEGISFFHKFKTKKGYETWKKYQKFFPLKNFILVEEDEYDHVLVSLIKKSTFLNIVKEHLDDFKIALDQSVTPENLLEQARQRPLYSEVLKDNELLIGILLGYGRENSRWFHQRSQFHFNSDDEIIEFDKIHHLSSAWTDEEFSEWNKQFDSVSFIGGIMGSHLNNLELMTLPGFLSDFSSSETQSLRKHYVETKKEIIKFYSNKDFLEATLRLLTS